MTAPLARGRDADVFALDERRILRRYRDGGDVAAEVVVMSHVERHGYPVPRVHESDGTDLVLERLYGPTLAEALLAGSSGIPEGGRLLADLHERLHRLPALRATDPGTRILHLDLHPENVIMTERGPVVIDWRNSNEGPPELDVALTAIILAQRAVDPADPIAQPAEALLAAFLSASRDSPLSQLEAAVRHRRNDPAMAPAEVAHLAEAAILVKTSAKTLR